MNFLKFSLKTFAIDFVKVVANRLYSYHKQSLKKHGCLCCYPTVSLNINYISYNTV